MVPVIKPELAWFEERPWLVAGLSGGAAAVLIGLLAWALWPGVDRLHAERAAVLDEAVVLTLTEEAPVPVGAARVTARVVAVVPAGETGRVRAEAMAAFDRLAPGVAWTLVAVDHGSDASGLERWSFEAAAELPDAVVGALPQRLRELSRPVLQLGLASVAFAPGSEALAVTAATLRARLYARVAEESRALATALPERRWRLAGITFDAPERIGETVSSQPAPGPGPQPFAQGSYPQGSYPQGSYPGGYPGPGSGAGNAAAPSWIPGAAPTFNAQPAPAAPSTATTLRLTARVRFVPEE